MKASEPGSSAKMNTRQFDALMRSSKRAGTSTLLGRVASPAVIGALFSDWSKSTSVSSKHFVPQEGTV